MEFGRDVKRADLERHFHAVIYAVGAQTDRHLGIPGESLSGSHSATEFVAWYNGHPDFRDRQFDLTSESVAIVGVGNVAVDVARILCLTPEELRTTDMADYAIEALSQSNVKDIYLLGRRGPVQAAFTTNEAKELGELPGADVVVQARRDRARSPERRRDGSRARHHARQVRDRASARETRRDRQAAAAAPALPGLAARDRGRRERAREGREARA